MADNVRPLRPATDDAPRAPQAPGQQPLWRETLGECLRRLRRERGETLVETAERAGVSPQYLSEMERGLKEPSSEMIAAVAGALGVTLGELALAVAVRLRTVPAPAPARPAGPAGAAGAPYAMAA